MGCTPTRLEPGMEVEVPFWPNETYFIFGWRKAAYDQDCLMMLDRWGTFVSMLYPEHIGRIIDYAEQRNRDEPHPPTTTGTA